MSEGELELGFRTLGQALARLKEALEQPLANPLAVDGSLQRFEFSIELYWKLLKRLLWSHGVEAATPRDAFRKAFAAGWLSDETAWLQLLSDRNATSHAYDEASARLIYDRVKACFPLLEGTVQRLRERFGIVA